LPIECQKIAIGNFVEKKTIFVNFFEKNVSFWQFFDIPIGNFLTVKWQFSGGSDIQ